MLVLCYIKNENTCFQNINCIFIFKSYFHFTFICNGNFQFYFWACHLLDPDPHGGDINIPSIIQWPWFLLSLRDVWIHFESLINILIIFCQSISYHCLFLCCFYLWKFELVLRALLIFFVIQLVNIVYFVYMKFEIIGRQ